MCASAAISDEGTSFGGADGVGVGDFGAEVDIDEDRVASACSGDALGFGTGIPWLPGPDASTVGAAGGGTAGVDMPTGPDSDLLIEDRASSDGCGAGVAADFPFAEPVVVCSAARAAAIELFCVSGWSGDELETVTVVPWLLAADACSCGCGGASTTVLAVLIGRVRNWLIWDKASGVGCGATDGPDLRAVSVFDDGTGVTTTEGKPVSVAMLVPNVFPALSVWDEPGAGTVPLDAFGFDDCAVGTLPVPGDPIPGNTVPS